MLPLALIVPCRLESTRFPRKLLHLIRGKPLLLWVAERLRQEAPELPLFFAVDDPLLGEPLAAAGFAVIPTARHHPSGTDRLAEANRTVRARRVINVQADEPLVTRAQILSLAELMATERAPMATLMTPLHRREDWLNPNHVKVVTRSDGRALYFTRAAVPFARELGGAGDDAWVAAQPCFRHLGLYAYEAELLDRLATLPPGRYEQIEKLEQLRVLENGYEILCGLTADPSIGVDTLADAGKFDAWLG